MTIHPTAIIDESAIIDDLAIIGPYCIIGKNSKIGAHTVLRSHVIIGENTTIGAHNDIYQFASVGENPQDLKYAGEATYLEIGDRNRIREACTIHRGTAQDQGVTRIGNQNLFMVNVHIAHDCWVGDHNVLANNVGVAGHAYIGNHVIIGGQSGVHQFCRIDDYSMIGGASLIVKDVAAYVTVSGNPAKAHGINKEGMRRKGWSQETIKALDEAYRLVFRSGLLRDEALTELKKLVEAEPKVQLLIDSITNSKRGLVR
ncbi:MULTISPECIES: acyl-ACP--UDP-N-acetylglucosamine O-acyltransferase [Moraxella]|uniref:Acyl-[acyl-carrier-protein]--UDP-N-acetylglucosamine O-acyltransferase n=1 Tax=Moraxella catarrhalis TaxID=480 RepID=A0A198UM36_MORCA|nr:acyl-ACP--UDP-N-acetylglucosamine O-acyltransferase [Moraxella catarrhalis]OAU96307.1 Acyl-acyl-carrier-protein--UDP-N- acetylglucosamine O-acyltransferase [Moraxella catarrhalis]OAU97243.1 Acyl-acyl-carrier-protein--UDP-N- acetylglucosamine O-acyltransferase [Moraxella catarrhalis]OAU99536.1 Acyl-acyl-carrier-protein--UDP-N- acetylglucosamine O-acyltransferase [Moraxella catarrhalis]OAV04608.1 Acyl-acyl-carrier-protein--UDP-N- acetylglucosamine O-acyltransferase [Moraxella catarrhalis]STY8